MQYAVIGLNHKTAPVAVREQLALGSDRLQAALEACRRSEVLSETVVLSTCNRVELYTVSRRPGQVMSTVLNLLCEVCQIAPRDAERFKRHLYDHRDRDALRHLFRVASSLDSMVIGESQIMGQLKDAFAAAHESRTVGRYLGRAMTRAFGVGKRVRTETRVGEGGISVSYVAAQLAGKIFSDLRNRSVLLVGAGDMAEDAAKNLAANGASRIAVANRTIGKAEALAGRLGGVAHPLEAVTELLINSDIVIYSTSAERPILHRSTLAKIVRARQYRPLFIIDIAVPRDVEPAAGELDGIYLYDVDDLREVATANEAARRREAQVAEKLVAEEVDRFIGWLDEADVVPTIVALREQFTAVKNTELERFLGTKLNHLAERDQKAVQALAHSIINKLLHPPTVNLKRCARNDVMGREAVDALQML
ncbi:MAG: glutamyl-tRNA reductase, partial [Myxococcota bacterium]